MQCSIMKRIAPKYYDKKFVLFSQKIINEISCFRSLKKINHFVDSQFYFLRKYFSTDYPHSSDRQICPALILPLSVSRQPLGRSE